MRGIYDCSTARSSGGGGGAMGGDCGGGGGGAVGSGCGGGEHIYASWISHQQMDDISVMTLVY